MTVKLTYLNDEYTSLPEAFGFAEDFTQFVTGDLFTDTSADSGAAVANVDAHGGTVTLTTGATDNNECYLLTTKELVLPASGKSCVATFRLSYTEANTDDANVCFGFMNAVGADSILDDGAGPKASYSGAVFFKTDGGTRWYVESSNAGTQTTTQTDITAGGSYQTFRVEITPISSTSAEVTFWCDSTGGSNLKQVREYGANPRTPDVKHTLTLTSLTEMAVFVGVKAGGANSEVVTVDYIAAAATR